MAQLPQRYTTHNRVHIFMNSQTNSQICTQNFTRYFIIFHLDKDDEFIKHIIKTQELNNLSFKKGYDPIVSSKPFDAAAFHATLFQSMSSHFKRFLVLYELLIQYAEIAEYEKNCIFCAKLPKQEINATAQCLSFSTLLRLFFEPYA